MITFDTNPANNAGKEAFCAIVDNVLIRCEDIDLSNIHITAAIDPVPKPSGYDCLIKINQHLFPFHLIAAGKESVELELQGALMMLALSLKSRAFVEYNNFDDYEDSEL